MPARGDWRIRAPGSGQPVHGLTDRIWRAPLAVSGVGHLAVLLLLVVGPFAIGRRLHDAPMRPATVDWVLDDPGARAAAAAAQAAKGRRVAPAAHVPAAPAPPRPPVPAPPAATPPAPPLPAPQAAASAAPPSVPAPAVPTPAPPPPPPAPPTPHAQRVAAAPPPAARPAPQPDQPPPTVRLGSDDITGETDEVFGPHTAPPTEDHTIRNIPPRYPRAAARRGVQGRVVLLLRIGTEGTVLNAEVYQTSGSPDLDAAAMKAVMSWHFRPAEQDGFPVESTIPYSFTFELTDRREDVQ